MICIMTEALDWAGVGWGPQGNAHKSLAPPSSLDHTKHHDHLCDNHVVFYDDKITIYQTSDKSNDIWKIDKKFQLNPISIHQSNCFHALTFLRIICYFLPFRVTLLETAPLRCWKDDATPRRKPLVLFFRCASISRTYSGNRWAIVSNSGHKEPPTKSVHSAAVSRCQHKSAQVSTSQHKSAPVSTSQHQSAPVSTSQHKSVQVSTI